MLQQAVMLNEASPGCFSLWLCVKLSWPHRQLFTAR